MVSSKGPACVRWGDRHAPEREVLPWPTLSLQVYLAHNPPPPWGPTVGLCLGPYGGPRGAPVSYERGTPVALDAPWVYMGVRVGSAGLPRGKKGPSGV